MRIRLPSSRVRKIRKIQTQKQRTQHKSNDSSARIANRLESTTAVCPLVVGWGLRVAFVYTEERDNEEDLEKDLSDSRRTGAQLL
jgi:hypothetical protein